MNVEAQSISHYEQVAYRKEATIKTAPKSISQKGEKDEIYHFGMFSFLLLISICPASTRPCYGNELPAYEEWKANHL